MKIVVIGTRGFPNVQGGVETHCEYLYPYIKQSGCDVTVITRGTYVDVSLKEFKGIKLLAVNNPQKKSLEAIVHTFFAVIKARRIGCDLLHVHAIGPALMVPFARLLGLKVVMTNHGPDYDRQKWGKAAKFMLKLGESFGSRFSNKVISISKPIADNLKKNYGCEAVIIPNGVVVPEVIETEGALNQFGLERNKYILTVGRFVPEKGFHDLIKAFGQSDLNKSGYKLVIVGDADHEDEYSLQLKREAKAVEGVVLSGFQKGQSLQELYSHASLFVLPSYHEGLPIVLLEAMSYGLSCIVSDIPANRNVSLYDGRHFKPGDIQELKQKLQFYTTEVFALEESLAQIEKIRQDYDWKKISKSTVEVYKKQIRGSKHQSC
ncbi:Alpha-D-GlcNAc alpha-1,2-L-rhamnosyltransferase [hydrothermal vent metagenome]|uniref:Alpha-D-GlcNAc alpha-1,2-L-rhamnosyltransferase n=1 Tax=hydrothermal vent metagenome TaxID=652676 RepID=A0A3B1E1P8_9ZZZZ